MRTKKRACLQKAVSPGQGQASAASAETVCGPDELLEALLDGATDKRRQNSLRALKRTLDVMRDTNAQDYSIAAVARAITALGFKGPKEQSIRNAEGSDFRKLIACHMAEYQVEPKSRRIDDDRDLVDTISDPRAATRVQALLGQIRGLQRRNDYLHAEFSRLKPLVVTHDEVRQGETAPCTPFSTMEVKAVRKFLASVADLLDCCFDADTGALIHERTGLEAAPPGLHQALVKVVQSDKQYR